MRRELDWSGEEFAAAPAALTELRLVTVARTAPSGWTVLTPDSAVHALVGQAVRTSLRVLDEVTGVRRSVERLVGTYQPIHRRSATEPRLDVLLGEAGPGSLPGEDGVPERLVRGPVPQPLAEPYGVTVPPAEDGPVAVHQIPGGGFRQKDVLPRVTVPRHG
ncbi:hypothetical protein LRE75_30990 [Streptomyces sp. 372A]